MQIMQRIGSNGNRPSETYSYLPAPSYSECQNNKPAWLSQPAKQSTSPPHKRSHKRCEHAVYCLKSVLIRPTSPCLPPFTQTIKKHGFSQEPRVSQAYEAHWCAISLHTPVHWKHDNTPCLHTHVQHGCWRPYQTSFARQIHMFSTANRHVLKRKNQKEKRSDRDLNPGPFWHSLSDQQLKQIIAWWAVT